MVRSLLRVEHNMNTTKQKSKLYLHTETIMQLQSTDLDQVRGGAAPPPTTKGTGCTRISCATR